MGQWHTEAEAWAHATVAAAASAPPVFLTPVATMAATTGLQVFIGPASMQTAVIRTGGSASAEMAVDVIVRAGGNTPAEIAALSEESDALVAALAANGARAITTSAATVNVEGGAAPVPARTITATVVVNGEC